MTERFQKVSQRTKEKLSASRNFASEKIGRLASRLTFNQSSVEVADYDDNNPEKYTQDLNFATYELNLREAHYLRQKDIREYYKDKSLHTAKLIGSTAMTMPGLNVIRESVKDSRNSRKRLKEGRKKYKERNGTFTSNLSKRYAQNIKRFDENKISLQHRKDRLTGHLGIEN